MNKKDLHIVLITLGSIAINLIGKALASAVSIPLWLDTFGTVLAAYVLGPFAGAVVGAATNVIYGFTVTSSMVYAVVSIAIGVLSGIMARKDAFKTLQGTMGVCAVVTLTATAVSTVINAYTQGGMR